jgi:hypothetical protein
MALDPRQSGRSMNRPLASLLTLVAALLAIVWLVFGFGSESQTAGSAAKIIRLAPPEEFAALENERVDGPPEAPLLSAGLIRSTLPGTNAAAFPAAAFGEIRVLVVDAKYHRPVLGATVWLLNDNLADGKALFENFALSPSVEHLLNELSERGTTNQDGLVTLPFYGGELKIGALYADAFTFTTRELGVEDPVVVELRPALHIPVKVVDGAGNAVAGAPVSLRLSINGEWRIDLLHTTTDENGYALLKNIGLFKEDEDLRDALCVGLALPLAQPVEIAIPLPSTKEEMLVYAWPENLDPLLLTMPETGPVEVFLFDVDGQPFGEEVPVYLYSVENFGTDPKKLEERKSQAIRVAVRAVDGVAHFPWTERGKEVFAECFFGGDAQVSSSTGRGPASDKEAARLDIFQNQGLVMVRGQLFRADGTPLPPQSVPAVIRSDTPNGMNESPMRVVVGEQGRFNFSTTPIEGLELQTITLVFQIPYGRHLWFASSPLPMPLTPGSFDLGILKLGEPPLLVAGMVQQPDGTPAVQQVLNVEIKLLRGENQRWHHDRSLRAATQSDGRFRISGLVLNAQYRLKLHPLATLPVSIEFSVGTEDLPIQLVAAGQLSGRVLVDDFLKPQDIRVMASFPDVFVQTQEDSYSQRQAQLSSFEFQLQNIPYAAVDLQFRLNDSGEIIDSVHGLQPGEGIEKYHPRLDPVDLRGKVFRYQLRAVDTDGQPIQPFRVAWVVNGKERVINSESGVASITTVNPSLDIRVMSQDYHSLQVHGVRGDLEVVLVAPVWVAVDFPATLAVPPGYRLGVLLRPASGPFLWQRARTVLFHNANRAYLQLGEAGRYLMTPYLESAENEKGRKEWILQGNEWLSLPFEISDEANQVLKISFSKAQMDTAARSLESQD